MIFSQSQFYDVIQYAESKNLDPKIFMLLKKDTKKVKRIWGSIVDQKVEPYTMIGIRSTDYYFKVELNLLPSYRWDTDLDSSNSYTLFGNKKTLSGSNYTNHHNLYFHVLYSPGAVHFDTTHNRFGLQDHFSWNTIFEFAKLWVDNLVDEIHAIESISRINMIPNFFSSYRDYNNSHQTYSGQQGNVIKAKVKSLKARINEEIPMSKDQSKIINEKLDELILKIDKINKFDYRTLFFGIMTNIASSVLYDNAPQFWKIVKSIFSNTMLGSDNSELLI